MRVQNRKFKDSGVPWLGKLPDDWKLKRLKHVGTLTSGSAFPPDQQDNPAEELPFFKVADLASSIDGLHISRSSNTVSRAVASRLGCRVVPVGAVAYAKIGAALLLNKRRITATECCIDNNMTAFMPSHDIACSKWAYYWLSQIDFSEHVNPGAVPSLSEGYQSELPFFIPPLPEQHAIAAFLDRETARIDALVEKKRRLLALLDEKRLAVVTHAVTKGLDPAAPMKDSGIDWLGQVPEHWEVMPFNRNCLIVGGQVDPKDDAYSSMPLIAPDHIESGTGLLFQVKSAMEQGSISSKYRFLTGDILYSKIRPELRKMCLVKFDGLCSADMYAIRHTTRFETHFLFYLLLSKYHHQYAVLESMRVAMPKVNRESLGAFKVLIPPVSEQKFISEFVTSVTAKLESIRLKQERVIDRLLEYRSALITNAVTGKIDVRGAVAKEAAA
jgi:type I restriction enzyme, S subunit